MSDRFEIRCPRLGGEVFLEYCLKENAGLPCSKTIECWQPYCPIATYLQEKLTEEQWERCFHRTPKEKVVSLVELVETAKRRQQGMDDSK
jgi:hypothetical protein